MYKFKTEPFAHQLQAFNLCKDKENFALFMEQGTGKTKVALDKACYAFLKKEINAVLIIAPNGVHSNWINRELVHVPDEISYQALLWHKKTSFKKEFSELLQSTKLAIFSINIDAVRTENGRCAISQFLTKKKTLLILDESSRIKNNSAQRTKAVIKFGRLAKQKLILSGTPVTQSPFDIYTQFKFLDDNIFNQTHTAFRNEYGTFEKKINYTTGYPYQQLLHYKNLDRLTSKIKAHSFRITKDECLDLPAKVYQIFTVELSAAQRYHYNNMRDLFYSVYNDTLISAPLVLTQLLRLQQIIGGFLTVEDQVVPILDANNKLIFLLDLLEDIPGKVIIWARFIPEIVLIERRLKELYKNDSVVSYYGETAQDCREAAIDRFQNDEECRFFVGNPRAAGIGLTLTAAQTVIYYSNDFSLETRLQSEDRAHRIGQKKTVTYIDIEANDTIDIKIIDALRNKKNIADLVTGDKIGEFLN